MSDVPNAAPTADSAAKKKRNPWYWVPSLYFAEGVPYVVVMTLAVILYKRLGLTNTDIAIYTSWLYLPWVIKPFWSPLVEMIKTKRLWILAMQVLIGGGLAGVALTIPAPGFVQATLAFFWLLAFASATHDIAADGFYMLALNEHEQAWWVGIRSTFYRAAIIGVSGLIPMLAGSLEASTGLAPVEAVVRAVPATEDAYMAGFDALPSGATVQSAAAGATRAELTVSVDTGMVDVLMAARSAAEVDSLIAAARAQNVANGFAGGAVARLDSLGRPVLQTAAQAADEAAAAPADEPSWWTRSVSGPLGRGISATFGDEVVESAATAGNVGIIPFRLSGPPPAGEEVAVNFGLSDGDKSLHLIEGERFVFTPENWDRPFAAVVQLDSKIASPTEASFRATSGNIPLAWSITFFVMAGVFLALMALHIFAIPRPASDAPSREGTGGVPGVIQYLVFLALFAALLAVLLLPMAIAGIVAPRTTGPWGRMFRALPFAGSPLADAIVTFFEKPEIGSAVAFVLFYRFAEGQLVKLAAPFLLDSVEAGGMALTTGQVGFVYGTVGALFLTLGGILGGILAARDGIGKWLWPMVAAINVPNAVYLFLAWVRPESFITINAAVAVEQFGYGFGFAAFLLVLIHIAEGERKTAHYAIATGLMALGMMIPGMISGWLQDLIGYDKFFVWILFATIPSFLVAARIRIDPTFGLKKDEPEGS